MGAELAHHATAPPRGSQMAFLPAATASSPPDVPDYRLVKPIGRGAFGTVWLAEDALAGVFRAVKVLDAGDPQGGGAVTRLLDLDPTLTAQSGEAGPALRWAGRELAGLHVYQSRTRGHPHLIQILKTGLCTVERWACCDGEWRPTGVRGDAAYYVMEVADHAGGAQPVRPRDYEPLTLRTLLRQKGRLPSQQVVGYAAHLLEAIDHLHRAGIEHRDVKPGNVLFVDGVIKLADVGLAATGSAESVGTPGYLPPEGTPCDLYALGKLIYEMTTGLSAAAFPEWPGDLDPAGDPGLPALRKLISELCHPDPAARLRDLRQARRRIGPASRPHAELRVSRRTALLVLGGAVASAALAGALSVRVWPHPSDRFYGVAPYDGAKPQQQRDYGPWRVELRRQHRPREKYALTGTGNSVVVHDLQSALAEKPQRGLVVSGAFQIYNIANPLTTDILAEDGEIDQLRLVLCDDQYEHLLLERLLYYGEPGARPGTRGRFRQAIGLDELLAAVERRIGSPQPRVPVRLRLKILVTSVGLPLLPDDPELMPEWLRSSAGLDVAHVRLVWMP